MSTGSTGSGRKDQGPQGTHVFSREEVSQLIAAAASESAPASGAQLTGLSAGIRGQSFGLTSARVVVGRLSSCDLQLDDVSVSSEHARLVHDSSGWRVVNLLSTNGTFVNGKKISNSALADGDRLRFGRVEFRFHAPDPAQSPSGRRLGWLPWAIGGAVIVVVVALVWLRAAG